MTNAALSAGDVLRSLTRYFQRHGAMVLHEVPLPNGRRADIMALLDQRRAEGLHVHVHQDCRVGPFKAHGKIMLIDGTHAVVGSLALTTLSIDFRREVAIQVTEPSAISDIQSLFTSIGVTAVESGSVPAAAGGASC